MTAVLRKREILDAPAFAAALDEAASTGPVSGRRRALLKVAKQYYQQGFETIRRRHGENGSSGRRTAAELSFLADSLIVGLHDVASRRLYRAQDTGDGGRLAVLATGGYGRGELAPYSDLDLLFLYKGKLTAWHEQMVEFLLYTLWDLGLKVGQAVRTPAECLRLAAEDLSIRTALLETRLIVGDAGLARDLEKGYAARIVRGKGRAFVTEKLLERDARHDRMGDSRYVVEPNLKDGKGGLRDLHTLFWITRFLYGVHRPRDLVTEGILSPEEARSFRRAESFLWTVRVTLHFLTGRATERLTFDVQPELARLLRYRTSSGLSGVERFMKHYFLVAREVGDLTRVVCAVLEARHQKNPLFSLSRLRRRSVRGFPVMGDRLTVKDDGLFAREPAKMVEIFAAAQESGLDIHPDARRAIGRHLGRIDAEVRRDPAANRAFLEVLTARDHPEINLRRMNEAGVFGRFIPDFGRVVCQMQYDMYHHYTVDEHTIHAIGLLAKIERGELAVDHPLANEIVHKVNSRRALYMAVLLHDIAKGRGGDHSEIGERIARRLCPRVGLSPAETDLVAWLVRWHLLMSHTAFKRDLSDRKTILDFCERVKSPERLRTLLVLTVVDIRAVGPNVWNGWKGQLLRELYSEAEEVLIAGHAGQGRQQRVAEKQEMLKAGLPEWSEATVAAHCSRFLDSYWIAEDPDTLIRNARLIADCEARGEEVGVMTSSDSFLDMTEVAVYTRDRPGLFARLSGAFAVAGANIVDAKIHTTEDGMALDNFRIQNEAGEAYRDPERLEALLRTIREAAQSRLSAERRIAARSEGYVKRTRVFKVEPMVVIDNRASNRATVIEVNARDRPGLLYDLTRALSRMRISVFSAHVATYGERAVDVFYVKDLEGHKIEHPQRVANIEQKLLAASRGEVPLAPRRTPITARAG